MLRKLFYSLLILTAVSFLLSSHKASYAQTPLLDLFFKEGPKQYFIKTKDGWTLSLYRYAPGKFNKHREPVILCHGFNYNSYLWDLDDKHSLARYLKKSGYDVWAVNLRGSGDSSKPALSDLRSIIKLQFEKMPQALLRAPMNIGKFDWTIDDHIHKDLPAIIEFVKSETGSPQVTWIGHSMGGMVMYAYLETERPSNIKNFIALGSMVNASQPPNRLLDLVASQKPITDASLLINTTVAYQLRNLTLGAIRLPWEELFYNKDNMDDLTIINMFRLTIDDTAPGVIAQFSDIIKNGDFVSVDKKFNYTENLHHVKAPILFAVGSKDRLATQETIRYAYEHVSSQDKTLRICSTATGYSADYGHCDLILGKRSEEEVYSYICRWLNQR